MNKSSGGGLDIFWVCPHCSRTDSLEYAYHTVKLKNFKDFGSGVVVGSRPTPGSMRQVAISYLYRGAPGWDYGANGHPVVKLLYNSMALNFSVLKRGGCNCPDGIPLRARCPARFLVGCNTIVCEECCTPFVVGPEVVGSTWWLAAKARSKKRS